MTISSYEHLLNLHTGTSNLLHSAFFVEKTKGLDRRRDLKGKDRSW